MAQRNRKYDLVVFGATGYTGKITSEQVLQGTPSTLRWAIAGRSPQKLELLAYEYNRLYPDRVPVEIFVADLSETAIERLAASTRLLISTVGPYIKYGTQVLEACAVYGTHYVDCTGEFPWVYEMIKRCHKTAQKKGAIIIPQAGFESAPVDLGTYALVKAVRDELGVGVSDVTFSMHDLKGGFSGGTFETAMTLFEHATLQEIHESSAFDALSPVKGPEQPFRKPIIKDEDLGMLTSWVNNTGDRSIVFRSWGLIDGGEYYGENFTWKEYLRCSNYVMAIIWFCLMKMAILIPLIGPLRWLARKYFHPGQGEGPSEEDRRNHRVEWRGVAIADEDSETPRKAFVRVQSSLDAYTLTAVCLVQVANSILFNPNTLAAKLGGGILTTATVASPELFRLLDRAGLKIEAKII
ncbi:Saccharopine dehydrogenase-domain-containing protein [Sphaerosporella brunnea]|uniref:Saccharopine dehydrogenase-domain-containing protein n=1 Tax=Sphaerosporella brunnea TaxID=1250544 RepID=A0A5J5F0A7_9PEZI|nr:Saccharopine dehydrogenase-domain-containing protein [Sphaerosporella brunnea]